MSIQRSGLQKQVLALYRRALRIPATKPVNERANFALFIRYTFQTAASTVSAKDVTAIEHLLRQGRKQIELLENEGVRRISVSEEMKNWEILHGRGFCRRQWQLRN